MRFQFLVQIHCCCYIFSSCKSNVCISSFVVHLWSMEVWNRWILVWFCTQNFSNFHEYFHFVSIVSMDLVKLVMDVLALMHKVYMFLKHKICYSVFNEKNYCFRMLSSEGCSSHFTLYFTEIYNGFFWMCWFNWIVWIFMNFPYNI